MRKIRRSPFKPTQKRATGGRHFSPLLFIGVGVSLIVALVGGIVFVLPRIGTHAATVNGDCTLVVPRHPLSAQGLATPYQLTATNADNGPCNEGNAQQSAFVQGAVIDPATGKISIYDPLVVDRGTKPAMTPVVPQLPPNAVVALWFGSNGNTLTLQGNDGSLQEGNCVNGLEDSIFGQFSYCNAPAFFRAANAAIRAGKLTVPGVGRATDGMVCPTTRDFSIVDQDQSDNVTTTYIVTASGQTAQDTPANTTALQGQQVAKNGSDERLLTLVDAALGCTPWMAPDLASPGQANMLTALPLNELQAAANQGAPVALVPGRDPMVLVNSHVNLDKVNAYRAGVDQPPAQNMAAANTRLYCQNLLDIGPPRFQIDARLTQLAASPDPAVANTLFTFLAQRFVTSFEANGLNCAKLLGVPDPVSVQTDDNGVAVSATINGAALSTPLNCSVNGTIIVGCNGTTTINGQTCSFTMDGEAHQVNVVCPAQQQ
jgi:hypothetical protein